MFSLVKNSKIYKGWGAFLDVSHIIFNRQRGDKQMARKPFGGMKIKPDANLAKIIGSSAVPPSGMTKKLWAYIKRKKLMRK